MTTLHKTAKFSNYDSTYYEFVEHNGKKFLITIIISNGDPIGFNNKQCFSVMTNDGDFHPVADVRMLGVQYGNNYHADKSAKETYTNNVVTAFKDFIKKLY